MTDFISGLRNVASNSTVQATAGLLAVGGFLANAVFGFGQTALSLGIQAIGAAVTLGVVAAKAATQNNAEQTHINQPDHDFYKQPEKMITCGPTNTILDNIISCGPSFLPSLPTRAKRRNADDDMLDMAKGTGPFKGFKPWM